MSEAPDWPPQASAAGLPDGRRQRGSTGQLFEVKNGQWVRIYDERARRLKIVRPNADHQETR